MAVVSLSEARMRMHELLLDVRVPAEYARIIEDHFLGNEVLGKSSHGIIRFPYVLEYVRKEGAGGAMKEVASTQQSRTFDANRLPGVVAITLAAEDLVAHLDASPESALAAVSVTNYHVISGVLGRYAYQLAAAGYIGIAMASSWAIDAPPGGREPMIGTNPIAVAVPSTNAPVVVDVTTAATAYGKVLLSKANGEEIAEGIVIDADGNPSRDPDDADNGAMLGLGDHKGFGLGLAVELLTGVLVGGDIASREHNDRRDGAMLLALRPQAFGSDNYLERVSALCNLIVESEARPGSDGPRLPGEKYALLRSPSEWPETFEVPDSVWEAFVNV
jgi:L-2-hydroxycarboxylate dehydrogenase (NAD+)